MRAVLYFDPTTVANVIQANNGNYGPLGARLVTLVLGEIDKGSCREALHESYGIEVALEGESVPMPISVDEAKAMHLIAERYLKDHAYEYFQKTPEERVCPTCGGNCGQCGWG